MYSPLPDQIVHSFVVVQDGTAIISVVLQIAAVDPTARRAGLCSFSAIFDLVQNAATITSLLYIFFLLIETAEWFIQQTPTHTVDAAGG